MTQDQLNELATIRADLLATAKRLGALSLEVLETDEALTDELQQAGDYLRDALRDLRYAKENAERRANKAGQNNSTTKGEA